MKDQNKEKKFIDLPEYPGGKKAFQEFIRKNLKYPKEALREKVEGTVHVKYRVDGLGRVTQAEVTHGIGSGCDEEALRVVKSLKYGKAKNRGVRVTASMRTKINFKIPAKAGIQYNYVAGKKPKNETGQNDPEKKDNTYGYTISF
jgi:TonB family protein